MDAKHQELMDRIRALQAERDALLAVFGPDGEWLSDADWAAEWIEEFAAINDDPSTAAIYKRRSENVSRMVCAAYAAREAVDHYYNS